MRRIRLLRETDASGVSGVGVVAEGVVLSSGRVVLEWSTPAAPRSLVIWDSLADAERVHGHNGATTVEWVDP